MHDSPNMPDHHRRVSWSVRVRKTRQGVRSAPSHPQQKSACRSGLLVVKRLVGSHQVGLFPLSGGKVQAIRQGMLDLDRQGHGLLEQFGLGNQGEDTRIKQPEPLVAPAPRHGGS